MKIVTLNCTILFCIIIFLLKLSESLKGYKIRQFKILCYNIDKTKMNFERCEIKAKRGTNGLLNIVIHYKGLKELQCHLQMFYRGTSGKYQPFLINVHMNPCDLNTHKTGNEVRKRVQKIFAQFDPTLSNGCPLTGPLNVSNFDFDKESEKWYPPVIAGGTFMIYIRAHDNRNHTYAEAKYFLDVKAIGLHDMISIG